MASVLGRLKSAYWWLNDVSGNSLEVLREAVQRFSADRAAEAAAGLAYYALFSLFPLLIALVAAGSFFLEREHVYAKVIGFVTRAIPISQQLIERNVQQVLELRGTVGVIGVIGLLWSATGFFTVLARHINRAWPNAKTRNFLKNRLIGISMVGMVAVFLILSLLATTVVSFLPQLQVPLWGGVSIYSTPLWTVLSNLVRWLLTFLMFLGLYRWVPNTEVTCSGAAWSALVAAFAWEVAANAFTWFVTSGLVRYELVYGSLGAVIALMLWVYVSGVIVLFGAYLCAAITRCDS